MSGKIEKRLKELGITLPVASAPVGSNLPFVTSGNLLFVSGQGPIAGGNLKFPGKIGRDLSIEQGKAAARLCAVNILAQASAAVDGDLDRIKRCVKVTVFVNAPPGFLHHPEIANGASDLFVEVFGDAGKHARAALGVSSLPRNIAVSAEAIFEVTKPKKA